MSLSLEDRLAREMYSAEACSAAIRGEKIPYSLGFDVTRLCVIRGIRYNEGFATELRGLPDFPEFTRALNARSIMSNVIPDMTDADEFPYCIWHPDLATEATYRELARRYPQMRYHVGRACAAAGYLDLYRELQLLPDVSIAEEARDNQKNGGAIFDEIMAQPTKYAVMDDYTRSTNLIDPRSGACLNGDTAVRSRLDVKQKHRRPRAHLILYDFFEPAHDESDYFNITEDWGIDDYDSEAPDSNSELVSLLYLPLPPPHLPAVDKDLLILVAAYHGNIDRYSRLRRPNMIPGEYSCVVRGIYHNTMWAKWWSLQPEVANSDLRQIRCAINARFIMNNELSRITEETDDDDLPYQIWYPSWACPSTYEELARRKPSMKAQVTLACIVADYKECYEKINATPDYFLIEEARASPNPYYLEDLLRKATLMHLDIYTEPYRDSWKLYLTYKHAISQRSTVVPAMVSPHSVGLEGQHLYNGLGASMSSVELFVCVADSMRPTEEFPVVDLDFIYSEMGRAGDHADRVLLTRGRGGGRGNGYLLGRKTPRIIRPFKYPEN